MSAVQNQCILCGGSSGVNDMLGLLALTMLGAGCAAAFLCMAMQLICSSVELYSTAAESTAQLDQMVHILLC